MAGVELFIGVAELESSVMAVIVLFVSFVCHSNTMFIGIKFVDIEATPANEEKPPVKRDLDDGEEVICGEEKKSLFGIKGASGCTELRFVLVLVGGSS